MGDGVEERDADRDGLPLHDLDAPDRVVVGDTDCVALSVGSVLVVGVTDSVGEGDPV